MLSARWRIPACWAGIFAVTLVAYGPVYHAGFIWDDDGHLTKPALRSWSGLGRIWFEPGASQQYYPATHTAFWLQHRWWGDAPLGYHLVNVLLHATAASLLGMLLRRLAVPGAWLAAGIFALHPVAVESAAWISEQKNTLSAIFYFAAALAYLRFDATRQRSAYVIATGWFGLALLSKTVTATLPAALLVVLWWQRGRISWRQDARPLVPWFIAGAAMGVMTAWVERVYVLAVGSDYALTLTQRCLIAGRVVWFYLGKLFWPAELIFVYPRWNVDPAVAWQYLFPVALLMALGALAWVWRRGKRRGPLAAALLYIGTLTPALGFIDVYPFRYSFVADHFQYLASAGIVAAAGAGIATGLSLVSDPVRRIGYAATTGLLVLLAALTWRQCGMYRSEETLYRAVLARNPGCWLAHTNLADLLAKRGEAAAAVPCAETAARLRPLDPEMHYNLGNAYRRARRFSDAAAAYGEALRLDPAHVRSENNWGHMLIELGRTEEARPHVSRALQLEPNLVPALYNMGCILQRGAQPETAADFFRRALAQDFAHAGAHSNLGMILAEAGRLAEALPHFQHAMEIHPDDGNHRYNLAKTLELMRQPLQARREYEAALRLNPRLHEAANNLGILWLNEDRPQDAIVYFEQALQAAPSFVAASYNWGLALQRLGQTEQAVGRFRATLQIDPNFSPAAEKIAALQKPPGRPFHRPLPTWSARPDATPP